jgi:UDP-N-acetylglucosamine diphosphorylase / glucose-1-phosphate thymidylyltransferase / UDP-N-acetylgalactosamine diphosphorylase / glucosamine-1-phosphate N-acetyltransferase / galactosamine-1-phosphate N-acetyltransferase
LGSGHALHLCKNFLKDRYLVLMGDDIYSKKDIKECLKYKRCMLVYEQKEPFTGNNILVKNGIFV